ncbi:MAG: DUF1724 domain-containing protein, partial [Candidatus Bathyarchaeota archaeon]
ILDRKPLKLTSIAKELGITNQQCIRHLNRLAETGLISKNAEGNYRLTPYGSMIWRLHPGHEFITKHRDYFISHTLSKLPDEFLARIGALSNSELKSNVMEAISELEAIIKESEEYLWVVIDKRTSSVRPFVAGAVERGVSVRSISPRSYVPSLDVRRDIVEGDELTVIKAEAEGRAEVADAEDFDLYLYMSEKAVLIAFPLEDGTFDYTGFTSSDQRAIKYCHDLFEYHWDRSQIVPRSEIVERHIEYLTKHGIQVKYP